MNLIQIIMVTLKISLFLTALGFGLKASLTNTSFLFRRPQLLLRSVLAMNIIMPLFAILLIYFFRFDPLINVSLIAISLSPLAPLFPAKPLKAGGSQAYITGLMVTASICSVILIPLSLSALGAILHTPMSVSQKPVLLTVLITVIIPLFAGIALRRFAPAFTHKIEKAVIRISQILLIAAVLPVLFLMFPTILKLIGNGTVLVFVAFVAAGLLAGHLLGGPGKDERIVLALAAATRHPAIAISLANANLTDHKLVPATILLYLLINAIAVIPYVKWLRKATAKNPETPI